MREKLFLDLDFGISIRDDVTDLHWPYLLHKSAFDIIFFVLVAEFVKKFPVSVYFFQLFLKGNLCYVSGDFDELSNRNQLFLVLWHGADSFLHGDVGVLNLVNVVVTPCFNRLNKFVSNLKSCFR